MKFFPLFGVTCLLLLPLVAQAGKSAAKDTVVVKIETSRGPTSVPLVRKGSGFVGPRGEYYVTFPSKKTLAAVYGKAPASKPAPSKSAVSKPASSAGAGPVGGDLSVVVVKGGVNIRRDGKLLSQPRTKFPDVRGWKLVRQNAAIVVKSGVGREPSLVELFDVRTGRMLEKVKATAIKDGKPGWAKNFAE